MKKWIKRILWTISIYGFVGAFANAIMLDNAEKMRISSTFGISIGILAACAALLLKEK